MKRRWLLWLLIIGFLWVVISRYTEIEQLAQILAQGQWEWVLAAASLQLGYWVVAAVLYRAAFRTVGVKSRVGQLIPLVLAALFVNVVAPGATASGTALFVDDARRRGQSGARTAIGVLLVVIVDLVGFLPLLVVGLIHLASGRRLATYDILGVVVLLSIISGLTGLLLLGLWQPGLQRRFLGWVQRTADRVGTRINRPHLLSNTWADDTANEFTEAAQAILAYPSRLARTLLLGVAVHLIDLATLYAVFLAFHQPTDLGTLIAVYAMAILWWVVSITPQGIGVVEGVMVLLLVSLGVPGEKATVISLAFRGLGFWLPFIIGFLMLRRIRSFGAGERPRRRDWSVRVIAVLIGLMGVLNVLSDTIPKMHERMLFLRQILPMATRQGAHLAAALLGFALLMLANALWRHKRLAWFLTMIVLLASAASHLVKALEYREAILSAVLAVWLWFLRPHFHASSDRPSAWQGVRALVAASVFTLAYGALGFYLLDRHFRVHYSLVTALQQTLIMFTQFYDPGLQPITGFGRYFAASIYAVGASTGTYALVMLLRPVLVRQPATTVERVRAQEIVAGNGRSSLARIALLEDKSYYFSPGGSVVAYVLKGRVALALGDPIGPAEDVASAVAGYSAFCTLNDWRPAFFQTLPDYLDVYRRAGWDTLRIGYEAIVDVNSFTLSGTSNKGLRAAINHMTKLGYRTELIAPPLSAGVLNELHDVSDEWLTLVKGTEKRFSLGWFDESYLRDCPVMAVYSPQGAITAFANIVSEYRRNEVTIDLMRHRQDTERGTMDYLIVAIIEWARGQGYVTFNLGLSSPTSGVLADEATVERALPYLYEHISGFYNFQGLYAFKDKFHPQWSPRYLVYPGTTALPAIAIALVRADAGDDLLAYIR